MLFCKYFFFYIVMVAALCEGVTRTLRHFECGEYCLYYRVLLFVVIYCIFIVFFLVH